VRNLKNSENNILSEGNMRIVEKQGYSNFPLNPSVNSGLEHDLAVNFDMIKHWVRKYCEKKK